MGPCLKVNAEPAERGHRELRVVGNKRVDDRARAPGKRCCDEGPVRETLGRRGGHGKINTVPLGKGDDHYGTSILG